tara:strand:- start:425 stop:775 length:351 start_codon:yes stop_codon:yes gene_type:complete
MNYLLFAEADVETSNEAMLLPASSFTGCDPVSGGITLFFNDVEGGVTREAVTLNCANGNQKAVLDSFVAIINSRPHSDGYIVVADADIADADGSSPTRTATFHKEFKGLVTGCTIA